MLPDDLIAGLMSDFEGLRRQSSWGETALFYNPGNTFKRGVYFATLKEHDGAGDSASHLDRESVFRLAFGLLDADYQRLFGSRPTRPRAGGIVATGHDFTSLDVLTPHPVYAWMGWVQVLCPTQRTMLTLKPLLSQAHTKAKAAFDKRITRSLARADREGNQLSLRDEF